MLPACRYFLISLYCHLLNRDSIDHHDCDHDGHVHDDHDHGHGHDGRDDDDHAPCDHDVLYLHDFQCVLCNLCDHHLKLMAPQFTF